RSPFAPRAEGERRRPLPRPRLSGAPDRPCAARSPQHEVGERHPLRGGVMYGEKPWHLLVHAAAFAIAGYALAQILSGRFVDNFLFWFLGAALLHDLVLLPLYSLADWLARRRLDPPLINHVRVPALLSGLLLLVYFPLILVKADRTYVNATGHHVEGYARNWLLLTAAFFLISALIYVVRKLRRT